MMNECYRHIDGQDILDRPEELAIASNLADCLDALINFEHVPSEVRRIFIEATRKAASHYYGDAHLQIAEALGGILDVDVAASFAAEARRILDTDDYPEELKQFELNKARQIKAGLLARGRHAALAEYDILGL